MSRTPLPDGSVRYAPDLRHRSKRKQPYRAALTALLTAVPLGAGGFFALGPARVLPIMGWTAVVTLVLVLIWRLTLPRQLSVTVSAAELTFRSYGRWTTIRLDEYTTAAARLVVDQHGFESRYLVFAGDGGSFRLNIEMWSEEDLVAIAGDRVRWTTDPAAVTVQQFDKEFPGLLPFHTTHPHRFAIGFVLVAVLAVVGVMAAIAALTAVRDDAPDSGGEARSRPQAKSPAQQLSRAANTTQNRLQAEVQLMLGTDAPWDHAPLKAGDCGTGDGWQRIMAAETTEPRPYTSADISKVSAAAERADLSLVDTRRGGGALRAMTFANGETEAALVVQLEPGFVSVKTASGCVVAE